jgi:hypothetical protein
MTLSAGLINPYQEINDIRPVIEFLPQFCLLGVVDFNPLTTVARSFSCLDRDTDYF